MLPHSVFVTAKGLVAAATESRCQSVLILEDDPVVLRAMLILVARLGHHAVAARSIAEALELLNGRDCAIVDLNLPDGSGTCILERIRRDGLPIRVAVATGTHDDALLRATRRLEPQLLLHKPIDVPSLLQFLDAV